MRDESLQPTKNTDSTALTGLIATITKESSLLEPGNFVARHTVRHTLKIEIERLYEVLANARPEERQQMSKLKQDALEAYRRLDQANEQLFAMYRSRIREGTLPPQAFRALLYSYSASDPAEAWSDPPRYDHLDTLLDGLLQIGAVPNPQQPIGPEMIPYQTTPLRLLLDMADRLALTPDDVFYDLGAGLGRVVCSMALMSAGQMKGIDVEPVYVEYAQQRAQDLNLAQVSFVNADARAVDYTDGTVFFLYTPFKGTILRRVLALLRAQARTRQIRVCTYGPGTLEIQDQEWLTSDDDPERDIHYVTIFESTRTSRRMTAVHRRRRGL
jgi:2-polyprenyl-3-methyl-5-hydroxy-6-metoxy-1,4-benzoquinol methylase